MTPFANVPEIAGCVMVMVNVRELFPAEFVALTVNEYVPAFVGVPEIFPALLKVSPAGRVPLVFVHVIAFVPVAIRVWEYARLTAPPESWVAVVIFGAIAEAPCAMVTVKVFATVKAPNTALTVNVYFPAFVGVPVIVPKVFSLRPGGRVPDDTNHVAGSSAPVSSALRVTE